MPAKRTTGGPVASGSRAQFSIRLRAKIQLVLPSSTAPEPFVEGEDYRAHFKEYLYTLHTVIRASVPLMQAAERRSLEFGGDALCAALTRYYRKHAKEEAGHDEWLLEDLEEIGVPRSEVLGRRPTEAVAELVGRQYYWIYHWHPVCLLGYIAVMEGYPPQRSFLDGLRSRTGYPEAAFRTLAKHSYLDLYHRKALYAVLDNLPLDHRQEEWVTLNAISTLEKWREITGSI